MIKFFVIVFMFTNTQDLKVVTFTEVPSLEVCAEKTLEINIEEKIPYNATCFIQKYYKDS